MLTSGVAAMLWLRLPELVDDPPSKWHPTGDSFLELWGGHVFGTGRRAFVSPCPPTSLQPRLFWPLSASQFGSCFLSRFIAPARAVLVMLEEAAVGKKVATASADAVFVFTQELFRSLVLESL